MKRGKWGVGERVEGEEWKRWRYERERGGKGGREEEGKGKDRKGMRIVGEIEVERREYGKG